MIKRSLRRLALSAAVLLAALIFVGPADAATWCVPEFWAGCPDNGENQVPVPGTTPGEKLQAAIDNADSSDGEPDRVVLAPGTYTVPDNFVPKGSDELEIVGASREGTVLTSSSTGNIYVVNLAQRTARVTMRSLSVVIPESFPDGGVDGYGAGIQIKGDRLERVDLVNRNDGTPIMNLAGGGELAEVQIASDNDSRISRAIASHTCQPGELKIDGLGVSFTDTAIRADCDSMPITINDLWVRDAGRVLAVSKGSMVSVTNAVIKGHTGVPIQLDTPTATPTELTLDHVTMLGEEPPLSNPAIRAVTTGKAGMIQVRVTNSVINGFDQPWELLADPAPASGHIDLEAGYSFVDRAGTADGDTAVTFPSETNLVGDLDGLDPSFAEDGWRLNPGSPLIDAGDPDQIEPDVDIEGNHRPLDGDLNGTQVRDIGASEYVPPLPMAKPLKVKFIKFRFRRGKGGRLVLNLNRPARVKVAFVPVPKKPRHGKRRKTVRLVRQVKKGGRLKLKLGRKKLKPGRYRLKVTGIAAGKRVKLNRVVRAR